MRWTDAAFAVRYSDNRALALLMSWMWRAAAEHGDEALLSSLQMNMLDAAGVANYLDWAGVPVSDKAAGLIQQGQQPSVQFTRAIPLGG